MEIIKSTNGFPYAWKAGRVEQLIRSILESKVKQQLNVNRVMFINPTWLHENDITKNISEADPDFIICHNFVDPVVPKIFDAIRNSGVPHIFVGNTADYRIDFWAIVCDLNFQNYEERDLFLYPTARKYICLNRKPHPHRINLVNQLLSSNVANDGFISLGLPGDRAITLDETFDDQQGIRDEYGNLGVDETFVSRKILNDVFSLGNLNYWNNSCACIVTETEFGNYNPDDFFTSEKTFKPIIGMRPFFIYGQPKLRQYLKEEGFDVFEDLFDYASIDESQADPARQAAYAQVAINGINKITNPSVDWQQKYFGRCQANKNLFRTYVYRQWDQLNNLDLTQYV